MYCMWEIQIAFEGLLAVAISSLFFLRNLSKDKKIFANAKFILTFLLKTVKISVS